jgi:hypothetical protein
MKNLTEGGIPSEAFTPSVHCLASGSNLKGVDA